MDAERRAFLNRLDEIRRRFKKDPKPSESHISFNATINLRTKDAVYTVNSVTGEAKEISTVSVGSSPNATMDIAKFNMDELPEGVSWHMDGTQLVLTNPEGGTFRMEMPKAESDIPF